MTTPKEKWSRTCRTWKWPAWPDKTLINQNPARIVCLFSSVIKEAWTKCVERGGGLVVLSLKFSSQEGANYLIDLQALFWRHFQEGTVGCSCPTLSGTMTGSCGFRHLKVQTTIDPSSKKQTFSNCVEIEYFHIDLMGLGIDKLITI